MCTSVYIFQTYFWFNQNSVSIIFATKASLSQKKVTWFVTNICHFFVFVYWRGTRKHFHWSKKYFRPIRIFLGPMKVFSCPPSINKNKEVTCFCDKSRHLFLWQTNRTRLIFLQIQSCFCVWQLLDKCKYTFTYMSYTMMAESIRTYGPNA